MPVLAMGAEKHADKLEDDDELQLESACENANAVCSDTPIDPELKSEGGNETQKLPVTEVSSAIIAEPELCSLRREEILQQFKRTLDGGLAVHDAAIDKDDPLFFIDQLSGTHLACHLPKCLGCPGCDMGKTPTSHA